MYPDNKDCDKVTYKIVCCRLSKNRSFYRCGEVNREVYVYLKKNSSLWVNTIDYGGIFIQLFSAANDLAVSHMCDRSAEDANSS